jgi:DNA polymerase III delta prime subunit
MSFHHALLQRVDLPLLYVVNTPDFIGIETRFCVPQFGIGNVRQLISDAYRRPEGEETKRVILVATEFITEEAQQALLKIIEEPPVSTRFIFVIPTGYPLLPTLESRFEVAIASNTTEQSVSEAFKVFLNSSYSERLRQIEEAIKQKNSTWQAEMKAGVITYLNARQRVEVVGSLEDLEYVARHLLTRGASNKMLLEHLALVLRT